MAAATRFAIQPGQTTSGIDFSLAPVGSIAGRVAARDTGLPFESCKVHARRLGAPPSAPDAFALCQPDGSFTLADLWPGRYLVWVAAEGTYVAHVLGVGSCNTGGAGPAQLRPQPGHLARGKEPRNHRGRRDPARAGHPARRQRPAPDQPRRQRLERSDGAGLRRRRPRGAFPPDLAVGRELRLRQSAPGTYRLVLDGRGRYASKAWNSSVGCSRWYCDPSLAQAVTVAAGGSREGLNFYSTPLAPYTRCARQRDRHLPRSAAATGSRPPGTTSSARAAPAKRCG